MKRYYGMSSLFGIFLLSVFAVQPITKKRRCALEPCMDSKIDIISSSFIKNSTIAKKYAYTKCGGLNISPALSWQPVEGAKSYIIIVEDPDAPSREHPRPKPFVHWLLFDIPSTTLSVNEDFSRKNNIGAKHGKNDFGNNQYDGPCPPVGSGKHRYFFKVIAVNIAQLGLREGASKEEIIDAACNNKIACGQIYGTFEMPK